VVAPRRLWISIATLAVVGCGPAGGDDGGESTTSTGTASEDTSSSGTTDGCPELPLCDLCPDESAQLCGTPCPSDGRTCSNAIGDGMSCEAGTWTCIVHPPLGTGCNDVCALAQQCSEIGCSSGVTVVLVAQSGTFAAGAYELSALVDDRPEDCTFTIADDPGACAIPPCVTDSTCNAIYLLGEDPMRIELAYGVVALLDVTLTRDATELAHDSFTPAYDVFAPNGPGCGPACAQASVELTVR